MLGSAVLQDTYEIAWGGLVLSTDPGRLDRTMVHKFLSEESYWAKGMPRWLLDQAIAGSIPFGLYLESDGRQIGFARVTTDGATFAFLSDVFVLPEHRGQGYGRWFLEAIMSHPNLQGLRRWLLGTRDAQGLYRQFGYKPCDDRFMELFDPQAFAKAVARLGR